MGETTAQVERVADKGRKKEVENERRATSALEATRTVEQYPESSWVYFAG